jgi:4-hydroxybenzoyl-CoA reductase subunit beta
VLRLPPIDFRVPQRLEDAVAALAEEDVRLVAGGTDLWPNMKRRHQKAGTVVSLMSVPGLRGIEHADSEIRIGATTRLSEIIRDEKVRGRFPAFARAVASISSPPLRTMATLGGNLCVDTRCTYYNQTEEWRCAIDYCLKEEGSICWVATKSPRCWAHSASDSAPILCALGAQVKLAGKHGGRVIPVIELFRDDGIEYLVKQPDEILTEVLIPEESSQEHCRSAFWKLRRRGSIDFAVLSVAAAVWTDAAGAVTRASIFLGAVGSSPLRVEVDSILAGKKLTEDLIIEAAASARKVATPLDNTDLAAAWRGKMAQTYCHAALNEIAGLPVRCAPPRHGLTVV